MNKKQFTLKMIQEIKGMISHGFHYQSCINIAVLSEFARLELGVNLFTDARINKGLAFMLISYLPSGELWITDNKKKHGKKAEGRINFCPSVAIELIEAQMKGVKIKAVPFFTVNENKKKVVAKKKTAKKK